MKYFFETYGCEMNKAESASTEQQLISRGWTASSDAEHADLVIINTCSVRATAETRIAGRLGWFTALKRDRKAANKKKLKAIQDNAAFDENTIFGTTISSSGEKVPVKAENFTLIVMGCMAQRLMEDLKKQFPVVDYVVGNFQKKFFDEIFQAVEEGRHLNELEETPAYTFASVSYEKGTFSAYVPIMHGCNNFCTYCIVPYVRGREISRRPEEILAEIDQLSKHNVKEITLLGQNVNSYCWNIEKNESNTRANLTADEVASDNFIFFPELLKMIAEHLKKTNSSIGWVRFMSSHPKDLSDELINVISEEEVLCHHIHLPVQHGSSKILEKMNRRYTREHYLEIVEKIRKAIPDVSLTTDIMLGFPGETEEDFQEAVSLMKEVRYADAFMYYYNPREGTPAAEWENQIPVEVKKERLQKIIDLQQSITKEDIVKQLGKVEKVLVEAVSQKNEDELIARTQSGQHVVFGADKSLIGQFAFVKLDELSGITFRGTLV